VTSVYSQRLLLLIVLLVMLPACSSADTLSTRDVRVTLTEFSIQASSQRFTPGVPYRLIVTNRGQVNHELRIAPPGIQGGPHEITAVDEMALQPGTAQTIEVTFPESAATTGLEFACHLPAHYEFGMHLPVTVR
jgi:uncharacterized cupredoxin-like copper-binding protein